MGWSLKLLRHRAAAQRTLLATVVAVALVGSTLLGTFALLLFASEHHAMDTALTRAPADQTEIVVSLRLEGTEPAAAAAAGNEFLDGLLGDVPSDRAVWTTSPMFRILGQPDPEPPLAYLADGPAIPEHAALLSGAWPTAATDSSGRTQVSVPKVAATQYGWSVGSQIAVHNMSTYTDDSVVVVGIHELTGPSRLWTRDLLDGAEHYPTYPVPGSFGSVFTHAWGPFVVAPDALTGPGRVASVDLVTTPRLVESPPGAVDALRTRLEDAPATLTSTVDDATTGSDFTSRLAVTIDSARESLAVTRVSLVIVGLMLVVLAVTVLLLAARLLADRRAPEQTLMSSRGASGRQLLTLATLEAAAVALVTTLLSPWLAALLFQAITAVGPLERAGLHHDPGRPATLWVTCAVASFVLAAVLLGPLLRRRGSVADAEQQLVRQDRRGGLARSGADLALLGLAGVALWQLSSYRTPVAATGPATLDPVLVLAPALLLLAGAVLALRLLPVITRVGERLAARSSSLTGPLAAWEVGRRPSRAAGAVLLLTLALGVGSFSQSFLSTWRTSQLDQVDLATGTDVRLGRMSGSSAEQQEFVTGLPGLQDASAVAFRSVRLGPPSLPGDEVATQPATLLAVDTTLADELLRGRITPGWDTLTEPLQPAEPGRSIGLPGAPTSLLLDIESNIVTDLEGVLLVTVVMEDEMSIRIPVALPPIPLTEVSRDVPVTLPAGASDARLVGVVVQPLAEIEDPGMVFEMHGYGALNVDLTVANLRAVEGDTVTPVALDTVDWSVAGRPDLEGKRALFRSDVDDDGVRVQGSLDLMTLIFGQVGFSATTYEDPGPVPVLATDTLLTDLALEVGDEVEVDLGGVRVMVTIVREVPYLPGMPRGAGLLADRDILSRSALIASWTGELLDEWWLEVPDDRAPALVDAVSQTDFGVPESRAIARDAATNGPLRVGVQAALWIVTLAAVALAVAGFAMSATVSVRTRRLELARLQALGAARSGLVRSVLVEHAILGVLGLLVGLSLGALLGRVVAPLITLSGEGRRPIPAVVVQWPWPTQLALVAVLVALVGLAVAVTTNALLRRASGELLRLGDER